MNHKVFEEALSFAVRAHSGQTRKDGTLFILHPMEVASIAATMTKDVDVLCAALLHDTVEDTSVTADEILETFGKKIAYLVESETENKRPHMKAADSWKIRKEESLEELEAYDDINVRILWLSDKLSNMRALARDYDKIGEAVFDRFNEKNPAEQKWYNEKVLSLMSGLEDTAAYTEYSTLFHHVFDKY